MDSRPWGGNEGFREALTFERKENKWVFLGPSSLYKDFKKKETLEGVPLK